MRVNNSKLFIYNDNTDITRELSSVDGEKSVNISTSNFLYVGFYKPLFNLFFEISTANETLTDTLKVERYNGTAWVEVDSEDRTNGLTKSSHLVFEQLQDNDYKSLEKNFTLDNKEMYWLKISSDSSITATLRYLNLVLCEEDNLKAEVPEITINNYYPLGLASHIYSLISTTNYIIKKINDAGEYKYNDKFVRNINQFDIFDLEDLRESATYYTLHTIYANISDRKDDVYKQKSDYYLRKFQSSFNVFKNSKLTLDSNDDGNVTNKEIVPHLAGKGVFQR